MRARAPLRRRAVAPREVLHERSQGWAVHARVCAHPYQGGGAEEVVVYHIKLLVHYVMLCYVMLCYTIVYYIILHYSISYHIIV